MKNQIPPVQDAAFASLVSALQEVATESGHGTTVAKVKLMDDMTETRYGFCRSDQSEFVDFFPSVDSEIRISKALVAYRNALLRSTGKRIWGLTFTLYPNGKYDIAYDYNKPEDYQDSDEVASTSASSTVADLLGGLLDTPAAVADSTFQQQALQSLQTQTAHNSKAWGLGTETQWNLEMDTGTLRFSFSDGRVLTAPVQVIGTYNTSSGTFLWGWDHPSVPEPLRRAAQRVHEYGQAHGIEAFTTRSTICSESDAWGYAAVAAQLDEAAGAYRGDAGGTWVYMVFAPPVAMG